MFQNCSGRNGKQIHHQSLLEEAFPFPWILSSLHPHQSRPLNLYAVFGKFDLSLNLYGSVDVLQCLKRHHL